MDWCDVIFPIRGGTVQIDEEDYERISALKWHVDGRGVAIYRTKRKGNTMVMKMHHAIIGRPLRGMVTDHINGDPLDNRKANLRICPQSQNGMNLKRKKNNASGQAGVSWHPPCRQWRARIMVQYREIHLGLFPTYELATEARLAAESRYFAEFAPSICRAVEPCHA